MVTRPVPARTPRPLAEPVRGDIWLAALDPTPCAESQKARPCVIISPPEMHDHLHTVRTAPITTGRRPAPFRIPVRFEEKCGLMLVRALYRQRLVGRLGGAMAVTLRATLDGPRAVFAE
jgi:mRNA interferase MazF